MEIISDPKIDLVDRVSILIKTEDENNFLFLQEDNNECNLPWERVIDGDWKHTALKILSLFNLEGPLSAIKLYKFWAPHQSISYIYHAIYELILPVTTKKKSKLKASGSPLTLKWVTKKDMHKFKFRNKELFHALNLHTEMSVIVGSPFDIELFEKSIDANEFLIEVLEKDVILHAKTTDDFYFNLIEFTNYTKEDQHFLYKEFLSRCFPGFYMSPSIFAKFMENYTTRNLKADSLFRAADLFNRGELSFRDFLYIVIACDSSTQHCGSIAEIRSKYIFRYYAQKDINLLQYNEFESMLRAIHETRDDKVDAKMISDEVEYSVYSIGAELGKPIDMVQFQIGVGELKIRGTSIILRFPKSVRNYMKDSPSTIKIVDNNRGGPFDSVLNTNKMANGVSTSTFQVCSHAVTLKKNIPTYDIRELRENAHWMSATTIIPNRSNSINCVNSNEQFSMESMCNGVLNKLKYFSDYVPNTPTMPGKASFSWAATNIEDFGVQLMDICNSLKKIVELESRLLDLKEPVYIFGDIHGNFPALKRYENTLWPFGVSICPATILFLGDYVDRGLASVEVIAYLFANKMQNSTKFYILRGNHEIREIQKQFTFYKECLDKFGETLGEEIWEKINSVFDSLPLAATINKKMFCCHGGVPPPWLCPSANEINNIPMVIQIPEDQSQLAWNLMWNDPVSRANTNRAIKFELTKKNGFAMNTKRGTGHFFSEIGLFNFLNINNYLYVIRAHEFQTSGIYFQFGGKLITVFSSFNYCGLQNDAACVFIEENKIRVLSFDC